MDIERIIHSDIPDIAQVYGGVRGRAMTEKHLGREWPMLLEAGLKTVIDLRYEDQTKRLAVKCEELGLGYFHFPVGRHGQSAAEMVEKFDEFCQVIDAGDFYISCREGLHRTDVALCIYWLFYGADHRKEQPELHGFLEEVGRDFLRMSQCLNAFFRKSIEKNGTEPIPLNVFKERKALIKKAWEQQKETEIDEDSTFMKSVKSIKLKYVLPWLKDQLGRPGWFNRLVVDRTAWGAFSIYSHLKRSNSEPKIAHPTRQKAVNQAEKLARSYGGSFEVYKCLFCDGWHTSRVIGQEKIQPETAKGPVLSSYPITVSPQAFGLDVDRILSTGIPDLAPVYGGFRGRTLSSSKQHHAWNTLLEAGIRQIIDLRADYKSDFYQDLCDKSGIAYYHYPIADDESSIDNLVNEFPVFCSLMDKGGFYIACAMGLHRTDIALCTYWVFHAADKGIAPPPIRGYRRDKGLVTDKIMRILNKFYRIITTSETPVSPIPESVFKERKNIIVRLSKSAE